MKEHRSVDGMTEHEQAKISSMWLEDGTTCADCRHAERCCSMFGSEPDDVDCQFFPNRFQPKEAPA